MTCCSRAFTRRQWMWRSLLGSGSASGMLAAAAALLRDNITIDVHTHAGMKGPPTAAHAR